VLPEYILVEVYSYEHRGWKQWAAEYRYVHKGKVNYYSVVVNFGRHLRPSEGLWWVKPTNMASEKWVFLAEACAMAKEHRKPLSVRTGDELVLSWGGNENQRIAHRDGWTFHFGCVHPFLIDDEFWRVQVERIDPSRGHIIVSPLGPDPRKMILIPQPIWYIDIRSLEGEYLLMGRVHYSTFKGQEVTVEVVSELGYEYRVRIEQMRLFQRGLIGLVHSCRNFQVETRLAWLLLNCGSPVSSPEYPDED
jgi:hypothetical protein